ncbi:MAG TPA: hypothetical protein VMU85_09960 [Stellaceae bacterium]|nr:hypothetical protein [Stellaceae bacterium]
MQQYRLYFHGQDSSIVGRMDFTDEDDASAIAGAQAVCDVCSDVAGSFELWQADRHITTQPPPSGCSSEFERLARRNRNLVQAVERIAGDSRWTLSRSSSLQVRLERVRAGKPG